MYVTVSSISICAIGFHINAIWMQYSNGAEWKLNVGINF